MKQIGYTSEYIELSENVVGKLSENVVEKLGVPYFYAFLSATYIRIM